MIRYLICVIALLLFTPLFATTILDMEIFLQGERPLKNFKNIKREKGKKITVYSAQNEFNSFIITFPKLKDYKIKKIKKLKLISKSKEINSKMFFLGGHNFNNSSFGSNPSGEVLDILVPLDYFNESGFKIPKRSMPSKLSFYVEIYTQPNAVKGLHKLKLEFQYEDNSITLPVEINVFDYLLPKKLHFKTSFGFAPWGVLKKHYGKWDKSEHELYEKYFNLASSHRIDLHKIYSSFPKGRKEKKNLLSQTTEGKSSFVDLFKNLRKGRDSSYGYKWQVTNLPVAERSKNANSIEIELFWKDLNKSVKAEKIKDQSFVYFDDEPKKERINDLVKRLKKIKGLAPDLNFLVTTYYQSKLESLVNWWCPNIIHWDTKGYPLPKIYQSRQKWKKEKVWFYSSCNSHGCDNGRDSGDVDLVIDRPSSFFRAIPILGILNNFDGFLYYDTIYGYNNGDDSPWDDPFSFSGYGEGNLFYPCNKKFCNTNKQYVLPSLRMKIFRDGMEDSEILHEVIKRKTIKKSILHKFIKNKKSFPKEIKYYENFKKLLLGSLSE
jgi:hypothetical protein